MLTGCYLDDYRNIEEVQIESMNPIYGFPLINSNISIADLLNAVDSSAFVEVRNDSVFIVFEEKMNLDLDLNEFKVPDKSFSGTLNLTPTGVAFDRYAQNFTTIENDSEIKRIKLKGGTLSVEFDRDVLDSDMVVEVIIHSLTTPEFPDSVVFTSNWGVQDYTHEVSIDLAGAVLELQSVDEQTEQPIYNTFSWATSLQSSGHATGQVVNNISISGVEFEEITGLINYEVPLPTQTLDLGTFTSIVDGEIYFSKPSVALQLGTSFGIPSAVEISKFTFKNKNDETRELQNEGVPTENTLLLGEGKMNFVPYATLSEPVVHKLFLLNSCNSNLEDILPFVPVEVEFEGKLMLGSYDGIVEDPHSFFVKDTSSIDIDLGLEVPLAGSIKDLTFQQDINNFSWPVIDSIPMLGDLDYDVEMKLKTTNTIPLTFGLQVVFIDNNNVAVDSLFNDAVVENIIIKSPNVDNQGLPIPNDNITPVLTSVKMDKEKYDKISKATHIRLKLYLETGTEVQPAVLFKVTQDLKVQMMVEFDLQVQPEVN